jgi:hypothetical protein
MGEDLGEKTPGFFLWLKELQEAIDTHNRLVQKFQKFISSKYGDRWDQMEKEEKEEISKKVSSVLENSLNTVVDFVSEIPRFDYEEIIKLKGVDARKMFLLERAGLLSLPNPILGKVFTVGERTEKKLEEIMKTEFTDF